jgi:hypothetical protein
LVGEDSIRQFESLVQRIQVMWQRLKKAAAQLHFWFSKERL